MIRAAWCARFEEREQLVQAGPGWRMLKHSTGWRSRQQAHVASHHLWAAACARWALCSCCSCAATASRAWKAPHPLPVLPLSLSLASVLAPASLLLRPRRRVLGLVSSAEGAFSLRFGTDQLAGTGMRAGVPGTEVSLLIELGGGVIGGGVKWRQWRSC